MMIDSRDDRPVHPDGSGPVSSEPAAGRDLDLAALLRVFARRWKVVAGTVVIATALSLAAVSLQPRTFEAVVPLLLSGPVPAVGASMAPSIRTVLTGPVLLAEVAAQAQSPHVHPDDVFVDPVPNTPFVRLRVHDRDPQRASTIAFLLGERIVASSRKFREDAVKPPDRRRLDQADAELRASEQELVEFRQESNIELLRREQEIRLQQQADAIKLDVEIEAERARLDEALERLDGSVKGDGASGASSQADARVAAESRGRLAALERRRARTRAARDLEGKGRAELYRRELQLRRLEHQYELARGAYFTEFARVRRPEPGGAASAPVIDLVEGTAPPAYPVGRDRLRLTLLVVVSSFLLGVALVILLELVSWRVPAGRRGQAAG